jgi:hypothetical protein
MIPAIVRTLARAVVLIMLLLLAACPGIPNDGRYQDHDGGRSNFRAEAQGVKAMTEAQT